MYDNFIGILDEVRNALAFMSEGDRKAFIADLLALLEKATKP